MMTAARLELVALFALCLVFASCSRDRIEPAHRVRLAEPSPATTLVEVASAAVSPDGNHVAIVSTDGLCLVYRLTSGQLVAGFQPDLSLADSVAAQQTEFERQNLMLLPMRVFVANNPELSTREMLFSHFRQEATAASWRTDGQLDVLCRIGVPTGKWQGRVALPKSGVLLAPTVITFDRRFMSRTVTKLQMLNGFAYNCSSIVYRDGHFVVPLLATGARSLDSVTTVGEFDARGMYVRSFGPLPTAHRQTGLLSAYQTILAIDAADSVLIGYSTLNAAFDTAGTQQAEDWTGSRGDNGQFLSALKNAVETQEGLNRTLKFMRSILAGLYVGANGDLVLVRRMFSPQEPPLWRVARVSRNGMPVSSTELPFRAGDDQLKFVSFNARNDRCVLFYKSTQGWEIGETTLQNR